VEALLSQYPEFELVRIGIEKAFDDVWWEEQGFGTSPRLAIDLANQGINVVTSRTFIDLTKR
jgi:hypothetical protein